MNIYQARYRNALKWAERVNNLVSRGYQVYDDEGYLCRGFVIEENGDILMLGKTDDVRYSYFLNDADLDNGMYTNIRDYDAYFNGWHYIHPDDYHILTKE